MRRLLTAAVLGLLATGIMAGTATAAPFHARSSHSPAVTAEQVHYDRYDHRHGYHRPHYAPPRSYSRHHQPRYSERHYAPHRYGYRY